MSDLEIPVAITPAHSTSPTPNAQALPASSAPIAHKRFAWIDFWMIILMIIWGSNIVLLKAALNSLPPFVLNGIRFAAATVALSIIFKIQGVKLSLPRREWGVVIGLAFLGQVVYQGLFLYALHMTTVANSTLILTTVPVWVVIFNAWRGHERLSRPGVLGVMVALVGVATVIMGRDRVALTSDTLPGDLLTLVSALVWAAVLLMMRRPLQRNPPMPVAFWTVAWAAAFQLILSIPDVVHLNWQVFQPGLVLAILYSGVVSIGIGNAIWNQGIKKLGTGRPAVYTYLEPVVGGIAAAVLLNEPLTIWLGIGGCLVLLGVILVKSS